ncbi:MAG: antitoxin [Alphaproteobacteria bacterium]|jgi:hypothetical protein|nr:antitoxin [Alphaproteobacteria bacterium]
MVKLITVTEMTRKISDVFGRVYYKGESFDIKKGSHVVARLTPANRKSTTSISELNEFFKCGPHLDKEDGNEFEKAIKEIKFLKDKQGVNKWD